MLDFFYTLFIFPIETVISVFYWLFLQMFEIHGIAIICLSVTVNIILLPLYNVAERWQQRERNIQAHLKNKLDDIRAVFKGAERHMIIRTYYRQNHYHPFYSLRNVIGLAIQIPFFIAAYHFLSHMPMSAKTSSYYFIKDLMRPDALLTVSGLSINLLPVVMTVINLVSAFVYSGKLQKKEKNQLFIMALLFLVLLYNSPAGLVLYWTMNNVISLIKNIINSGRNPRKYFYITLAGFAAFMFVYSLLLRYPLFMRLAGLDGFVFKAKKIRQINIITGSFFAFVLLFPVFSKFIHKAVENIFSGLKNSLKDGTAVFALSCIILFMLTGLVAPSFLISGSPLEFAEVISGGNYNPSWAIVKSALQAFSLFIFIPSVIYILFSRDVKKYLILLSFLFAVTALVNIFIFSGSYGVISPDFTFDNSQILKPEVYQVFLNFSGIVSAAALSVFLIKKKYYKIINNLLIIIIISLASISAFNIHKINSEFRHMLSYNSVLTFEEKNQKSKNIFTLSKKGENVFVIMLDRALGGLMGEVLNHNPEFLEQMTGFVWYPNTVSFNGHTLLGAPPLFGGYEYTPVEMNKRDKLPLVDKHNEALLVMPRIFLESGYEVKVTDPSNANYSEIPDLSIFKEYPGIKAELIVGKFTSDWINENIKDDSNSNISEVLNEYLLNFSIFRIAPNFLRSRIYDSSRWLKPVKANLPLRFIDSYSILDYLPRITGFDAEKNTFNMTVNYTIHEPRILNIYLPEEFRSTLSEDFNYKTSIQDSYTLKHFYTQIGAFQKLCKWFNYLKENNVYSNTKIIIVSDHGRRDIVDPFFINFSDDNKLTNNYTYYHPLLLVKEFNAEGKLKISDDFMTNADVPSIAVSHLDNGVNPFTGNPIKGEQKKDGVDIVTVHTWKEDLNYSKYKFKFSDKDIIHVKNNIFIKENWTGIIK